MPEWVTCDPTPTSLRMRAGQVQAHTGTQAHSSQSWDRRRSVHQVGVSRLDLQHPYLALRERPGRGGSTAYSSLSRLKHTALPEGELRGAARGLVP